MRHLLLCILFLTACSGAGRQPNTENNRLDPFVTDGCSNFPDGVPYFKPALWRECCVIHDIAYWQGGTSEQREEADSQLRECVAEKSGEPALAQAMYLGVRAGGYDRLPTTWHWGYGWVLDRGDKALDDAEQAQVAALLPIDPLSEPIQSPGIVRERKTLSGDYCLDIAIQRLRVKLGPNFHIKADKKTWQPSAEGTRHIRELQLEGHERPYSFEFLLLQEDACTTPMNEMLARGRIRLTKYPK